MFEKRSMGLEPARRAVEAVLAAVAIGERPVAVAVADENGELVHAMRMDGAGANDMRQAERKAYTAAFMARDTSGYRQQLLQDGRTLADWSDSMLTTLTGGLTVKDGGRVVGGIGIHGNGPEKDAALARVGVDVIEAISQAAGGKGAAR